MNTNASTTHLDIILDEVVLKGILGLPDTPRGLVLFSHGSGSSRLSSRNNYVASVLQQKGMATLLFDLLTEDEDRHYETRFNIPLLTERLIAVTDWCRTNEQTQNLRFAYFGASTGAASALGAAAHFGAEIAAVVSRGGRPDMALDIIEEVSSPTLFLVGGLDGVVIGLNQKAYDQLPAEKKMHIIPGASHLFEEPGKLEQVAGISASWFNKYF